MLERSALFITTLFTAISLYNIPSWQGVLTDVCLQATIMGCATIVLLHITRLLGARAAQFERYWLMLFLIGMPLVYITGWLLNNGGESRTWLWLEILGLPIYTTLAVLGIKRSIWFLIIGIIAHGLVWDAWHWFLHTSYIPIWYAQGCLIMDVGIGVYLATRVPTWRTWEQTKLAYQN